MPTSTKKPEKKVDPIQSTPDTEETVITVKSAKKPENEELGKKEPEIKFEGVPGESEVRTDSPLEGKTLPSFSLLDSDKPLDKSNEISSETTTPIPSVPTLESKPTTPTTTSDTVSSDEINHWVDNKQVPQEDPSTEEKPKKGIRFVVFILILAVVAGAVAGGFYYYNKNVSKSDLLLVNKNPEPTETPTDILTPEPTKSTEKIDFNKYSLQILNGSGIPGEAGKVKDLLSSVEFKNVSTANASNYDFTNTIIELKKDTPSAVYDKVKELIGNNYSVELQKELLSEKSSFDLVITVGSKK